MRQSRGAHADAGELFDLPPWLHPVGGSLQRTSLVDSTDQHRVLTVVSGIERGQQLPAFRREPLTLSVSDVAKYFRGVRWVMSDKTQAQHNESAHPPIADMRADIDFCRSGPPPDSCAAKKSAALPRCRGGTRAQVQHYHLGIPVPGGSHQRCCRV